MKSFFSDRLLQQARVFEATDRKSFLSTMCLGEDPTWDSVRSQIDQWVAEFPVGKKLDQIVRDMMQFNASSHLGPFFELSTYFLCKRLNLDVEPNNGDIEEYPEYFIKNNGKTICLEVTTIQSNELSQEIEDSVRNLCLGIEKRCKPCWLIADIRRITRALSPGEIKNISSEISQVVWKIPAGQNDIGKTIYTKSHSDYDLAISILSSDTDATIVTPQTVGTSSSDEQQKLICQRVRAKIKRHKKVYPNRPLIVLLGYCHNSHFEKSSKWRGFNAMYGHEEYLFSPDTNKAVYNLNMISGLVTPTVLENGSIRPPENTSLSGVIDVGRRLTSKGWLFEIEYSPNVFGKMPVIELCPDVPSRVKSFKKREDGQIESISFDVVEPYTTYL